MREGALLTMRIRDLVLHRKAAASMAAASSPSRAKSAERIDGTMTMLSEIAVVA